VGLGTEAEVEEVSGLGAIDSDGSTSSRGTIAGAGTGSIGLGFSISALRVLAAADEEVDDDAGGEGAFGAIGGVGIAWAGSLDDSFAGATSLGPTG